MRIFDLKVTFKCEIFAKDGMVKEAAVFERKRRAIRWAMSRVSARKFAIITIYLEDSPEKKHINIKYHDVAAMMHNSGFEGAVDHYNAVLLGILGL